MQILDAPGIVVEDGFSNGADQYLNTVFRIRMHGEFTRAWRRLELPRIIFGAGG